MSVTAQKQDIADPDGDPSLRDRRSPTASGSIILYLLTCADIAGTSPKLWNAWKDRLLADLYTATRLALRRGLEHPRRRRRAHRAKSREAARSAAARGGSRRRSIEALFARMPDGRLPARTRRRRSRGRREALARARRRARRSCARAPLAAARAVRCEVFVHSPDRDGLFAAIVATLDRLGLAIQQARLLDGPAARRVRHLRRAARRRPAQSRRRGQSSGSSPPRWRRRDLDDDPSRAAQRSRATCAISGSRRRSQFDDAAGRTPHRAQPGLRPIAPACSPTSRSVLRAQRLRVHDARIATFGERAEDVFRITDERDRAARRPATTAGLARRAARAAWKENDRMTPPQDHARRSRGETARRSPRRRASTN